MVDALSCCCNPIDIFQCLESTNCFAKHVYRDIVIVFSKDDFFPRESQGKNAQENAFSRIGVNLFCLNVGVFPLT